jgi:GAF domain-containing protein
MEPDPSYQPGSPGPPQVLESFAEVIEAIDSDATVDEVLHLVARKICLLVGCSRCGVYLKNPETSLYHGQAIESSQAADDEAIRALICGTDADRLTREILATKEPVLVRNAQDDPRTVRSVMRRFGVRSILGVPMIVRDEVVGLMFLDDEHGSHPFSDEHQAVASTFAQLAGLAIKQAQRAADRRTNMRTIARQNELLRHSTAIEERLTRLVLEGGSLADIAKATSELTGKPCAIHDAAYRRLAVAGPAGVDAPIPAVLDAEYRALPEVEQALAGLKPNRPGVIGPAPIAGLLHRFVVMPIALQDESWGYLVLMEFGSRFTALDTTVARRAATAIAFELAVERRAAVAEQHARQALVRDLVNGLEDQSALFRRAEVLGFALSSPHVIALLGRGSGGAAVRLEETERVWTALGQPEPMWGTSVPGGAVAIAIELDQATSGPAALARVKDVVERLRRRLAAGGPVLAAISARCTSPSDYAYGYAEAVQIMRSLASLRGSGEEAMSVLAADDLGAGRLILNMVERAEADRFTRNTLGPVLGGGNRTLEELLVTLRVFFESGRSVRNSARYLAVHENTIRYRLGRIYELTGLDVATDSDAQLTIQVALLILKIQGRLPAAPPGGVSEPAVVVG